MANNENFVDVKGKTKDQFSRNYDKVLQREGASEPDKESLRMRIDYGNNTKSYAEY